MTEEPLSARERHTLDHVRQAEALGVSLEYYASAFKLQVRELHSVRQQLVRKGILAVPERTQAEESAKPSAFVPVRLVPTAAATAPAVKEAAGVACRLVHPNGWVIECRSVPEAAWVQALLAGACP